MTRADDDECTHALEALCELAAEAARLEEQALALAELCPDATAQLLVAAAEAHLRRAECFLRIAEVRVARLRSRSRWAVA